MLGERWESILDTLGVAFQPVVNIHSGHCIGYEALLRNFTKAGFNSPPEVFDAAFEDQVLAEFDLMLLGRALEKFSALSHKDQARVFFNLHPRLIDVGGHDFESLLKLLEYFQRPPSMVCFESGERRAPGGTDPLAVLRTYRERGFRLVLDDFGAGPGALRDLYELEPDFIKLDRRLIADLATNTKRKGFVAHLVAMAHSMSTQVVAEGVENKVEFFQCRELAFDLVQGYFVQRPTPDANALVAKYNEVEGASKSDRRDGSIDKKIIYQQIQYLAPIPVETPMLDVFERFRADKDQTLFPVVDAQYEPLGIVRERSMKEFVYSKFGRELITHSSKRLRDFVTKCPIADINSKTEAVLETFNRNQGSDGILIVADMRYLGFLSARSLLAVVNEKNIHQAREQNPLSKLPGNTMIHEFVAEILATPGKHAVLAYIDFDHFKAFNDKYGFRQGDRAILMFAELMKKSFSHAHAFLGHVGGDDFFIGFTEQTRDEVCADLSHLIHQFQEEAESLYAATDRYNKATELPDRDGLVKLLPLLSASAVVLEIPAQRSEYSLEQIGQAIAEHKHVAKQSPNRLHAATLV